MSTANETTLRWEPPAVNALRTAGWPNLTRFSTFRSMTPANKEDSPTTLPPKHSSHSFRVTRKTARGGRWAQFGKLVVGEACTCAWPSSSGSYVFLRPSIVSRPLRANYSIKTVLPLQHVWEQNNGISSALIILFCYLEQIQWLLDQGSHTRESFAGILLFHGASHLVLDKSAGGLINATVTAGHRTFQQRILNSYIFQKDWQLWFPSWQDEASPSTLKETNDSKYVK